MTRNLCKLCFQVDLHLCSRKQCDIFKANAVTLCFKSFRNIPHNFKEATLVSFQTESDAKLHIKQAWSVSNLSLHHTLDNDVWNQKVFFQVRSNAPPCGFNPCMHFTLHLNWSTIYTYTVLIYHQTKAWGPHFDCVLAWLG